MLKRISMTLFAIIISILLFTACSNSNSPSTIQYNNKTILYNSTKSDIQKAIGNGEPIDSLYPNMFDYDKSIKISYNKDKIRCIEIDDSNTTTYNGIKVGDSISNVLKQYQYEQKSGDNYMISFSNGKEIDITNKNQTVDFWINYSVKNDKISKITLYDSTFAKTMG